MKRILVTGGSGFIGGNFIKLLQTKPNVEAILNVDKLTYAGQTPHTGIQFIKEDIGNRAAMHAALTAFRPTHIVNFAAESHVDRSIVDSDNFIQSNVVATHNFVSEVQKYVNGENNVRFIHISTDEVYGQLNRKDPGFTELSPLQPRNLYSATKASAEHIVNSFRMTHGLPSLILNCSNNYGPYQHPEKFIPVIISNALQNKPIPVYGMGMNIRDWLYVTDNCEAIYLAMSFGQLGEKYNVGADSEIDNFNLAKKILLLMNKPTSLIQFVTDRKGHDFRYAMDHTKISNRLKWQPTTSLDDGLEKTIGWYMNNEEWVRNCYL